MKIKKKILVVVAHSDDDILGCGATIAKHRYAGDLVRIIFMTNGVSARSKSNMAIRRRKTATKNACKKIDVDDFKIFDFPDNRMDSVDLLEVIKSIEAEVRQFSPEIIYTHHRSDLNVDHRIVHQAVITAVRPLPDQCVNEIRAFEVLSSTEWSFNSTSVFTPNLFVDITDFIEIKIDAFETYSDEIRTFPHPRSIKSIKALAITRGAQIGFKYAEAFDLIWKKCEL